MGTLRYSAARKVRGTLYYEDPALTITEQPSGGSTVDSTPTVQDAVRSRRVTNSATNNFAISTPGVGAFISKTPAVASVNAEGEVRGITNGLATIDVVTPTVRKYYSRTIALSTAVTVDTFQSWVAGSLSKHVDDAIRAMASGKTPGAATQAVLTTASGGSASPNYVRNANLFTGALDLAAISVYTSSQGNNKFPVVLLSQRHLIAGHVGASPGQTVVFKRTDGNYEVRTVVSQLRLADTYSESYVALLDSPITTISPMPLLPATFNVKLPSLLQSTFIPNLHVLNKGYAAGDWIRVLQVTQLSDVFGGFVNPNQISLRKSQDPVLSAWSSPIIGGDSNGPVFMPINGVAVLCHCMNYTTGGGFYPQQLTDIQAKMDTLAAGQLITQADVSGFTSY